MKKIAITGGKGGTGKSTVATALAHKLSENHKVLLLDLDVDCPNDSLILGIKAGKVKDVMSMLPKFDFSKCVKCGKCAQACKANAIVQVIGKNPILVPEQCNGCKACMLVCPAGAISEDKQVIGAIHKGQNSIDLIYGALKPNIEESSLIVNAAKKFARDFEKDYDYVIIDTSAGTHCPVISALLGVDLGIAVTEPTPLGAHDLRLIVDLMKKLGINSKIVLNRSDITDSSEIKSVSKEKNAEIIAEIPFSKEIAENYAKGKPIEHEAIDKIIKAIK